MLVWEPVLGHAGDPARMPASVGGDGSLWGAMDDARLSTSEAGEVRRRRVRCGSAAEPDTGWRSYLDRQHSIVAEALGVCAVDCRYRCTVITRHTEADAGRCSPAGCRVAAEFTDSTLIQLRHSAPVGHGFGVPSPPRGARRRGCTPAELSAGSEPAVLIDDGYPLPGLPSLFSALAGAPIGPDTMILETVTELRAALA